MEWRLKMRGFCYARVSGTAQARDGESLAVQQETLEALCRLEGIECAAVFIEEAVSGSRPFASRPEGSKLLAQLKSGDVLIATKLDRCFRDAADALQVLAMLEARGVHLYLKDLGGWVTGNSTGRLVFGLMSSVAAFERSRIRERITEVRSSLRAQSRYLGGDPPFGSRLIERDGERFLEPDAELLAEVQDLNSRGYSSRLIAGHFAQQGRPISHHAVARLLRRMREAA